MAIRSLKGDRAFRKLRTGRSGGSRLLAVRWRPGPAGEGVRVGIVVSRKVGKAVVRNTVRRRLRASMGRIVAERWPDGARHDVDLIVIARPVAADATSTMLEASLRRALARSDFP